MSFGNDAAEWRKRVRVSELVRTGVDSQRVSGYNWRHTTHTETHMGFAGYFVLLVIIAAVLGDFD